MLYCVRTWTDIQLCYNCICHLYRYISYISYCIYNVINIFVIEYKEGTNEEYFLTRFVKSE